MRNVTIGTFNATAKSSVDSSFIGGRFTGAYLVGLGGNLYAKPQLDVAVTHLERDGYTETGTGGIALTVAGANDTIASVSPSVEVGTELSIAGVGVARPFIRGGATWVDNDKFTTSASFAGAPPTIAPFTIASSIDKVVADVAAGVDLLATDGMVLRLEYDGRFGEDTRQHGGAAKLSVPF